MPKEELIEVILGLYDARKEAKDYLEYFFFMPIAKVRSRSVRNGFTRSFFLAERAICLVTIRS